MRILCVTGYYKPAYVYGGPVRSVSSLCEALARGGAQVTIFTTNANGSGKVLGVPTDCPVEVDGVEVHYFPLSWPAMLMPFYSHALGRACHAYIQEFDVVYLCATWTYPMLAGARAALQANIPYVLSPRGSFMIWSMSQKALKKRLYLALVERALVDHAAAIHCTSLMEKRQTEQWGFRPPCVVIPNGLDLSPFASLSPRRRLRKSLGLPREARLSIFVGRMHPEKRLSLIVEAFAQVAGQLPDTHLAIIGPDAGSGHIARQQVEALGISDRVHFLGLLTGPDLLHTYADADMLILLSHRESFGMAAVEAMAAGLPVLLAKEVGLAEEVAQAGAGYVVSTELDQVASAWSQMLCSSELRQVMGAHGRALVQQRFSSGVVATQMLNLLSRVSARNQEGKLRKLE